MEMFEKTIFIQAPAGVVFAYVTNIEGYHRWLKVLSYHGRILGKGPGQKCSFSFHNPHPDKLTLHVTGWEENKFFRLEALKGCRLLPCYTFRLEAAADGGTSLQLIWEEKGLTDPIDHFFSFRFYNINVNYSGYLRLLRQLIHDGVMQ